MAKKIDYQKLEKELVYRKKNCWETWGEKTRKQAFDFSKEYKSFLNKAKTEREAVKEAVKLAQAEGFVEISGVKELKPGDKVYYIQRDKGVIFAVVGKRNLLDNGFNMLMSHVDSPHLDFKASPLYEDEGMVFLKSHYYGGIKKYQWPTIALALHGVVYLENGKEVEIVIGEKEDDPVFMITDLLPHLDHPQVTGAPKREVKGEDLNLLVGSIPVNDQKIKNKVKLAVLEYLYANYKIKEEDLTTAELQAVPSEKARDLGFDRSLISAYGHDDRSCSFAAIKGLLSSKQSDKTKICVLVDREEIGSEGNTGAKSIFFESFVSDLLRLSGQTDGINSVYKVFSRSRAISGDVAPAIDPDYKDVHDIRNAHQIGFGTSIEKYTGGGGKFRTSEASASFVNDLVNLFKKNKDICYQLSGGLGKIDQGGGGTIAMYMANRNMEIVDMGVPVLNMHAPLEIISKADIYSAYLAYKAFLEV